MLTSGRLVRSLPTVLVMTALSAVLIAMPFSLQANASTGGEISEPILGEATLSEASIGAAARNNTEHALAGYRTDSTSVFVSRGEFGEVVFSDENSRGARQVDIEQLDTGVSEAQARRESERRIESMLDVAGSLANSRSQRERIRANERAARQQLLADQRARAAETRRAQSRRYYPYYNGYRSTRHYPVKREYGATRHRSNRGYVRRSSGNNSQSRQRAREPERRSQAKAFLWQK